MPLFHTIWDGTNEAQEIVTILNLDTPLQYVVFSNNYSVCRSRARSNNSQYLAWPVTMVAPTPTPTTTVVICSSIEHATRSLYSSGPSTSTTGLNFRCKNDRFMSMINNTCVICNSYFSSNFLTADVLNGSDGAARWMNSNGKDSCTATGPNCNGTMKFMNWFRF